MPKASLAAAATEKRHVSLMIGDASDTVEHHAMLRAPEYQAGKGTSAGKDAGAATPKLTGWQRVAGLALMVRVHGCHGAAPQSRAQAPPQRVLAFGLRHTAHPTAPIPGRVAAQPC